MHSCSCQKAKNSDRQFADAGPSKQSHLQCTSSLLLVGRFLSHSPTSNTYNQFTFQYAPLLVTLQATEALSAATDFALSTFNLCGTSFPDEESSVAMRQEGDISPYSKACLSLKKMLTLVPEHFVAGQAVAAFGGKCQVSNLTAMGLDQTTLCFYHFSFSLFFSSSGLGTVVLGSQSTRNPYCGRSKVHGRRYLPCHCTSARKSASELFTGIGNAIDRLS